MAVFHNIYFTKSYQAKYVTDIKQEVSCQVYNPAEFFFDFWLVGFDLIVSNTAFTYFVHFADYLMPDGGIQILVLSICALKPTTSLY